MLRGYVIWQNLFDVLGDLLHAAVNDMPLYSTCVKCKRVNSGLSQYLPVKLCSTLYDIYYICALYYIPYTLMNTSILL